MKPAYLVSTRSMRFKEDSSWRFDMEFRPSPFISYNSSHMSMMALAGIS